MRASGGLIVSLTVKIGKVVYRLAVPLALIAAERAMNRSDGFVCYQETSPADPDRICPPMNSDRLYFLNTARPFCWRES